MTARPIDSVSFRFPSRLRHCLALAACIAVAHSAAAQSRQIVEPKLFRLQIGGAYTGIRIDASHDQTNFRDGDPVEFDYLFMGAVFGLKAAGSVYHPNLMRFNLSGEISPGYATQKSSLGGINDRNEYRYLGNYLANFVFLASKPYRATVTFNQNTSYRDYDFFNRVEVNMSRYGVNLGYQAGPVPFTIDLWQRTEESIGQANDSSLEETGLTLEAKNSRKSGETSFEYTFTDYNRRYLSAQADSTEHSFGLSDAETFGKRQNIQLNTTVGYIKREYAEGSTDDINGSATLSIEHSPTLSSFYDANYFRSTSDEFNLSTESDNLNGGISLRHQLFESLTSTFRVQGFEFSSAGSFVDEDGTRMTAGSESTRFGGSITEQYTKRLGANSRLSLVGSILLEHTVQTDTGDLVIQTDERHTFSSSGSGAGTDVFFLNLPFVNKGSIVITDDQNTHPAYQEGSDYTVSENGFLTMIRRTGSSRIPQNSTVFVDYRADASPSGEYDTLTGIVQLRLDLWNNLLGLFCRMNSVQNSGSSNLVVQDLSSFAIGADTTWRWVRAGVEYETYDSTFSSYQTTRLFQALAFKPDSVSTLNFDFVQSWTQYVDAGREEENYSFMMRYNRRFTRRLGVNLEAGVALRQGEEVDQTLATVRPGLEFQMGRLFVKAGYDFEYSKYLDSSDRQKHMLFLNARRSF